ncbi:EamA family transporter [Metabacillus sp. RGM 3146]|uniref:EamA family transporter n=1 Tax=Metabacillus sp. RGM 3146 TaxID=3401092 RepID=UPI003B9B68F5
MIKGKLPFVYILFAAVLWGTTGTAQTFAPAEAHPISIGTIRLLIGGIALFFISLFRGNFSLKGVKLKQVLGAGLGMAGYQLLFFSGVKLTGIAIGTVIAIGSAPVFTGLIEWGIRRNQISKLWWSATLLSIFGCCLLFVNGQITFKPEGIVLALGAGFSFAIYTILSKELLQKHPSDQVAALNFITGAILLLPFLFLFDSSWFLSVRGAAVGLHLGILATAIPYYLFSKGLSAVPASTAVTLSLGEPLTASLLGVFVIGETFTANSWAGFLLIFMGIVMLTMPKGKEQAQKNGVETKTL